MTMYPKRERIIPYRDGTVRVELKRASGEARHIIGLKTRIERRVVGQAHANGEIAKAVHDYFMIPGEKTKNSIIMIGSKGVGKEHTLKTISRGILGIPFLSLGIKRYYEEGERIYDNLTNNKGAIICIKGIEGILGDEEMQEEILWMLNEKSNRGILHAFTGEFRGLEEIIKERMRRRGNISEKGSKREYLLENTKPSDLVEYGLIPELMIKIISVISYRDLNVEELYAIFLQERGLADYYKNLFREFGTRLTFTSEATIMIAKEAEERGKGAFGLRETCEKLFNHYERVSSALGLRELKVNREMVETPKRYLREIIREERNHFNE